MLRRIRRKKNGGFTLVEVLVAAAILSLVVPPILSSFVAIARVNSKSRMKLSATTIANGVMESVKGFDLCEIAKETSYPSEGFYIIAGFTGTSTEVNDQFQFSGINNVSVQKSGDEVIFNSNDAGKYTFYYQGVKMDGTTYDVVLRYTKNATQTNDDVEVVASDGSTISKKVNDIMGPMSVRVLAYYDVDIQVFRGGTDPKTGTPLAHITGTKADYFW